MMSDVQMRHMVEKLARRHRFASEAGVIIRVVLVAIRLFFWGGGELFEYCTYSMALLA